MRHRSKVPLLEVVLQRQSDVQTRRNGKEEGAHRKSASFEKCVSPHLFHVNNHGENGHNNLDPVHNRTKCLFSPVFCLQGCVPMFVNATAGTTVYGAFDPINEIADICEKYNMWLHVDVRIYPWS